MSQCRFLVVPESLKRRFWPYFLRTTLSILAVAETYAIVSQQRGTSDVPQAALQEALVAQGLSEKAAFPTLSAHLWREAGIYPATPRRYWTRPLLAALLVWFTLHVVWMVPGPCEKDVIDRVRAATHRRKTRFTVAQDSRVVQRERTLDMRALWW